MSTCRIDWRTIFPEDSFIHKYMTVASQDTVPEEYHLWCALLVLGLILGHKVTLKDNPEVYGNLYICMLGRPGAGKSRATRLARALLEEVAPFSQTAMSVDGVRLVKQPASGEVLIHAIEKKVYDSLTDKSDEHILMRLPVVGLVEFDEMVGLSTRAARQGNNLKAQLTEMYDVPSSTGTESLIRNEKIAVRPFASMISTTQPEVLDKIITDGDDGSGFLSRWLFVPPTDKEQVPLMTMRVDILKVAPDLRDIKTWVDDFQTDEFIEWSDAAFDCFSNWLRTVIFPTQRNSESNMLVRLDLLVKKLALLVAANVKSKTVEIEHVSTVEAIYPFILEAYGALSAAIVEDKVDELEQRILVYVKKLIDESGGDVWPTASEVHQALKLKTRKEWTSKVTRESMDNMVKTGALLSQPRPPGPKGGAPTTSYSTP